MKTITWKELEKMADISKEIPKNDFVNVLRIDPKHFYELLKNT